MDRAKDIFISYAESDEVEVHRIRTELETAGLSCFLAKESLKSGEPWRKEIDNALRTCGEILVIASNNSIDRPWVYYEIGVATALQKNINVILLGLIAKDLQARPALDQIQAVQRRNLKDFILAFNEREKQRQLSQATAPAVQRLTKRIERHFQEVSSEVYQIAGSFEEGITYKEVETPIISETNHRFDLQNRILPAEYADKILVHTIHAGDHIPPKFLDRIKPEEARERIGREIEGYYATEKDWGANYFALALCQYLNLKNFYRVTVSRALMDVGRFPGITEEGADHLSRFAINHPFSAHLDHEMKQTILKEYYDVIATRLESLISDKILILGIHTYDEHDPPVGHERRGRRRPATSIAYQSRGYRETSRVLGGIFDRHYPKILGEFTADRRLTGRITLDLERGGIAVGHNYPYLLPEGSVEVRSQVWLFFNTLRQRFVADNPHTADETAYKWVWEMLLDTELRKTQSEMIRSFIHMFREEPDPSFLEMFQSASKTSRKKATPRSWTDNSSNFLKRVRDAYERIGYYIKQNDGRIVEDYRFSADRPSSLVIEIRKDLIWKKDRDGELAKKDSRHALHTENVVRIGSLLASSILTYLQEDKRQISNPMR